MLFTFFARITRICVIYCMCVINPRSEQGHRGNSKDSAQATFSNNSTQCPGFEGSKSSVMPSNVESHSKCQSVTGFVKTTCNSSTEANPSKIPDTPAAGTAAVVQGSKKLPDTNESAGDATRGDRIDLDSPIQGYAWPDLSRTNISCNSRVVFRDIECMLVAAFERKLSTCGYSYRHFQTNSAKNKILQEMLFQCTMGCISKYVAEMFLGVEVNGSYSEGQYSPYCGVVTGSLPILHAFRWVVVNKKGSKDKFQYKGSASRGDILEVFVNDLLTQPMRCEKMDLERNIKDFIKEFCKVLMRPGAGIDESAEKVAKLYAHKIHSTLFRTLYPHLCTIEKKYSRLTDAYYYSEDVYGLLSRSWQKPVNTPKVRCHLRMEFKACLDSILSLYLSMVREKKTGKLGEFSLGLSLRCLSAFEVKMVFLCLEKLMSMDVKERRLRDTLFRCANECFKKAIISKDQQRVTFSYIDVFYWLYKCLHKSYPGATKVYDQLEFHAAVAPLTLENNNAQHLYDSLRIFD